MVGMIEVLIGYTALMTTVMTSILAFLLKDYFPLKSKVNQIYGDLYNNGKAGLINKVDEEHSEMADNIDEIRADIQSLQRNMARLSFRIEQETDAEDLPQPQELRE